MSLSRTRLSIVALFSVAVAVSVAACATAPRPRPARETGQPAPTACTSAEPLFLHNQ